MAITANELTKNPQPIGEKKDKEAPIQTAYRYLTTTEGKLLELMTRANPTMANAIHLGYIFDTTIQHTGEDGKPAFGNTYVAGRIEQVERVGVSMDGRGRQELIDALTAGGRLPESYYEKDKQSSFIVSDNGD